MAHLECQEPTLHTEIGADVLVYGPGKFVVKLPCLEGEQHGEDRDYARHRDQIWVHILPNVSRFGNIVFGRQLLDCSLDLIVLNGSVDKHATIVRGEAKDLNRVLKSQGVVNQN